MIIQGRRELLAKKVAWLLHKAILVFVKIRNQAVVGIPGDNSVAEVLRYLRKYELPWEKVHLFLIDEPLVPADHEASSYRQVKDALGLHETDFNLHQFSFDVENPMLGVIAYNTELQGCGGVFDIVLLSSGADGHIASLFPNHHAVQNRESGFILMNDAPKKPHARMTASYELIRKSDTGIILFIGPSRENALQHFYNIHLTDFECPAKTVIKMNRYYVFSDQEVRTP